MIKYTYKARELPEMAKTSFLNSIKDKVTQYVKSGASSLDVTSSVTNKGVSLEIKSLGKGIDNVNTASNFFNEVDEKEFFNVVSSDYFRERAMDNARLITTDVMRIFNDTKKAFDK